MTVRPYRFKDLGEDGDGSPLLPVSLNDRGDIAAVASIERPTGAMRGYHLLADGERQPLGMAFGQEPVTALNPEGQAAGAIGVGPLALRAWTSTLGDFGRRFWTHWSSIAHGVNALGQIIGDVFCDAGRFTLQRAFLLEPSGRCRLLSPPEGGTSTAVAINSTGAVTFNSTPLGAQNGDQRAWCLREHTYHPIKGLGGRRTCATAITADGRVVGNSLTLAGRSHLFQWQDGRTADLGAIPGCDCDALGVADDGTIVGRATLGGRCPRAFVWTAEAGYAFLSDCVDLPMGWTLHEARAINARGHIVGRGEFGGRPRGFILTPVAAA